MLYKSYIVIALTCLCATSLLPVVTAAPLDTDTNGIRRLLPSLVLVCSYLPSINLARETTSVQADTKYYHRRTGLEGMVYCPQRREHCVMLLCPVSETDRPASPKPLRLPDHGTPASQRTSTTEKLVYCEKGNVITAQHTFDYKGELVSRELIGVKSCSNLLQKCVASGYGVAKCDWATKCRKSAGKYFYAGRVARRCDGNTLVTTTKKVDMQTSKPQDNPAIREDCDEKVCVQDDNGKYYASCKPQRSHS